MTGRRLSPEQKQMVFEGIANPGKVSALCRQYGVSRSTFYRLRRELIFNSEAREDAVDDFLATKCMLSLPQRAERCLRQVLYRLPLRAAMTILDNPYLLVIYVNSFSIRAYNIRCLPHPHSIDYWFHIVTLTQEMETMSDEALVGAIAHELAHVFLGHDAPPFRCEDKEEFVREVNRREEEANNLAKKWGLTKEIEALRQWVHS